MRILLPLLLLASAARAETLAVLELKDKAHAKDLDSAYFTDVVRTAALEAAPHLKVMTRENVLVLLEAQGRKLEDCEGECEVDTARRLGADYVVSGEIVRVGARLKLDLRLHAARDGTLLAGAQASGDSAEKLDDGASAAVQKLLEPLQREGAGASTRPAGALPPAKLPAAAALPNPPECASGRECTRLALYSQTGDGVAKDYRVALALYARGCDLGDGAGCRQAGRLLLRGLGAQRDAALAAAYEEKACDAGTAAGCNDLGALHDEGRGVARDPARAFELFRLACASGYELGCANLGRAWEEGRGTRTDPSRALEAYLKACAGRQAASCTQAGYLRHAGPEGARSDSAAAELYRKGCELGDPRGCSNLARHYRDGAGIPRDPARAAPLYRKAVAAGYGPAFAGLGSLVEASDPSRAAYLYRRGCDLRDAASCAALKRISHSGEGNPLH
jgi:TPR repeat protein